MKRKYYPVLILGILFSLLQPVSSTPEKDYRNLTYKDLALILHPDDFNAMYSFSGIDDPQLIWGEGKSSDYFIEKANSFNSRDGLLQINRSKTLYYTSEEGLAFKTANIYGDESGALVASETSLGWTYGSGYINKQLVYDASSNQVVEYVDTIELKKANPYVSLTLKEYDEQDRLIGEVDLLGSEGQVKIDGTRIEVESVQEIEGVQSGDTKQYSRSEALHLFGNVIAYEYYDTTLVPIAKKKIIEFVF